MYVLTYIYLHVTCINRGGGGGGGGLDFLLVLPLLFLGEFSKVDVVTVIFSFP